MLICGKYFEHFWLGEYLQVCVKTNKNNKRMRNVTVTKNSHRIHLAPYIYTYKATDTQQNNAKKNPMWKSIDGYADAFGVCRMRERRMTCALSHKNFSANILLLLCYNIVLPNNSCDNQHKFTKQFKPTISIKWQMHVWQTYQQEPLALLRPVPIYWMCMFRVPIGYQYVSGKE